MATRVEAPPHLAAAARQPAATGLFIGLTRPSTTSASASSTAPARSCPAHRRYRSAHHPAPARAAEPALVAADTYNELFTMHGTTMISSPSCAERDVLQLHDPAHDRRAGRGLPAPQRVLLLGVPRGRPVPPLSFLTGRRERRVFATRTSRRVRLARPTSTSGLGLQILGVSSMVSGIKSLVTIINMRAPGMTLMRIALFVWMKAWWCSSSSCWPSDRDGRPHLPDARPVLRDALLRRGGGRRPASLAAISSGLRAPRGLL